MAAERALPIPGSLSSSAAVAVLTFTGPNGALALLAGFTGFAGLATAGAVGAAGAAVCAKAGAAMESPNKTARKAGFRRMISLLGLGRRTIQALSGGEMQ
jgi:hypothetical protein